MNRADLLPSHSKQQKSKTEGGNRDDAANDGYYTQNNIINANLKRHEQQFS